MVRVEVCFVTQDNPIGSGVRRCFVTFPGASTNTTYRVTMRGYHCWRAVRTDVGGGWPPTPADCVHIADQIRFWPGCLSV